MTTYYPLNKNFRLKTIYFLQKDMTLSVTPKNVGKNLKEKLSREKFYMYD